MIKNIILDVGGIYSYKEHLIKNNIEIIFVNLILKKENKKIQDFSWILVATVGLEPTTCRV